MIDHSSSVVSVLRLTQDKAVCDDRFALLVLRV